MIVVGWILQDPAAGFPLALLVLYGVSCSLCGEAGRKEVNRPSEGPPARGVTEMPRVLRSCKITDAQGL